jgi:hypothetical protein
MRTTRTPQSSPPEVPQVFIPMPYDKEFDHIYEIIEGVVRKVGADPIRLDKRSETGDILQKAHHYLRKASVVLAVITDHNANVLYEVGYAHACDRVVVPVIQCCPADAPPEHRWRYDIPFNLHHTNSVIYGNGCERFEEQLEEFLRDGISKNSRPPVGVNIAGIDIRGGDAPMEEWEHVEVWGDRREDVVRFDACLRNDTDRRLPSIFYADLHCRPKSRLAPHSLRGQRFESRVSAPAATKGEDFYRLTKRYRLSIALPPLAPGGEENFTVVVECKPYEWKIKEPFLLRIRVGEEFFHFPYYLKVRRR